MPPPPLPATFLYFKEDLKTEEIGLPVALVAAAEGSPGVYRFTAMPFTASSISITTNHPLAVPTLMGTYMCEDKNGLTVLKRLHRHDLKTATLNGVSLPLLTFSSPTNIFGPYVLRCKFINHATASVPAQATVPAPSVLPIPQTFIYYRKLSYINSAYVLCITTTYENGVYTFTKTAAEGVSFSANGADISIGSFNIKTPGGSIVKKRVWKMSGVNAVWQGESYPCLTFKNTTAAHKIMHGTAVEKLVSFPGTAPAPSPAPSMVPLAPVPTPSGPKPKPKGDLKLFVAKQLLELAQNKHEMCPIVAEEYAIGHTAAMPCGHLFADFAIQETFKKEPNKCPVCREYGRPTYV